MLQTAASLLQQLHGTSDAERKEWEAFAQTMYDAIGRARAERSSLQRYATAFLATIKGCMARQFNATIKLLDTVHLPALTGL